MSLPNKFNAPAVWPVMTLLAFLAVSTPSRAGEPRVALAHTAALTGALRSAHALGRVAGGTQMNLALTLPLRNQARLTDLLKRLSTPGDRLYGHFLTPAQFHAQFSPTEKDYAAVAAFARSQGLTVTQTHVSRTILDVAGPASNVEKAFGVRLSRYQLKDGRTIFANATAPTLPRSIAVRVAGVAGLTDVAKMHPHYRMLSPRLPVTGTGGSGTGPAGGLAPNDIKYAYSLADVTPLYTAVSTGTGTPTTGTGTGTTSTSALLDGTGQTVGLFELDGYTPSDIALYVTQFGLPTALTPSGTTTQPALQNVLIDGATGGILTPGGQGEVTLDIDMVLALAPNVSTLYVYEANQTTSPTAALDMFQRMADDTATDGTPLLKVISNSWGSAEVDAEKDPTTVNGENAAFQQMAAQGQSIFSASGDSGAYGAYVPTVGLATQPAVDDPSSQPFMTGVGGTTLSYKAPTAATATVAAQPGVYVGETVWSAGSQTNSPEGSGGGPSIIWSKPDYQQGLGYDPNRRDVPDVALDADPNTGYDIYVAGKVGTVGGTSAAAPLWAGFFALINEQRTTNGLGTIGFANPILYGIGRGANYAAEFHDVTTGNNLFFPAEVGYDDATGFGSFIGDAMLSALSLNVDQGSGTGTITGTVTDDSAIPTPIAGATVTATSTSTGAVKATTTTDGSGNYSLNVPAGLTLTIAVDTSTVTPATDTSGNAIYYAGQSASGVTVTASGTTAQNFALSVAHTFAAGLQMISAPYDFTSVGDFAAIFGLVAPLQANPRLIQWEPGLNSYVFYPTAPADTMRPGQAYWIKFPAANYLHRQGTPVSTAQAFTITLQPGWNQIGDPFLASAPLSGITVDTPAGGSSAALASSPLVQSTLYDYDPTAGQYVALDPTVDTLDPYNGYWIYATAAAVLSIPPESGPPGVPGVPGVPGAP